MSVPWEIHSFGRKSVRESVLWQPTSLSTLEQGPVRPGQGLPGCDIVALGMSTLALLLHPGRSCSSPCPSSQSESPLAIGRDSALCVPWNSKAEPGQPCPLELQGKSKGVRLGGLEVEPGSGTSRKGGHSSCCSWN